MGRDPKFEKPCSIVLRGVALRHVRCVARLLHLSEQRSPVRGRPFGRVLEIFTRDVRHAYSLYGVVRKLAVVQLRSWYLCAASSIAIDDLLHRTSLVS